MAGAILVALGFIGLEFHRNRNVETDQKKLGARTADAVLEPWGDDLYPSCLIGMVQVFGTPAAMTEVDLRPADEPRQTSLWNRSEPKRSIDPR